jgi:hypothetical protein
MSGGDLKYGNTTSEIAGVSLSNFVGAAVHGFSMCTTPIEIFKNDGSDEILGHATGFFWLRKGQPYLVTNYHVISGRNVFTGQLDPKTAFIPRKLRFHSLSLSINAGIVRFDRKHWYIEVDEAIDELMSKPPEVKGVVVDIWGIPILPGLVFGKDPLRVGFPGSQTASCFVNEHQTRRIVTNVGDDCLILGYPLQNYEGLMLPIWKRGSIATDTNIGVGGRPIFLVDAATTPGMSGSPIFRKAITFTADNKDVGALQEFAAYEFIGIYAGRLQSKDLERTSLGYGWYANMLEGALEYYKYGGWVAKPTSAE